VSTAARQVSPLHATKNGFAAGGGNHGMVRHAARWYVQFMPPSVYVRCSTVGGYGATRYAKRERCRGSAARRAASGTWQFTAAMPGHQRYCLPPETMLGEGTGGAGTATTPARQAWRKPAETAALAHGVTGAAQINAIMALRKGA